MVEVGTLNIKGTIDTSDIQRGQRQIRSGFRNVEEQGKSTFGSLNRLQGIAVGLGNAFGMVASAGTGALATLASLSPILAPTFAKIGADTKRLSIAMGKELKPAFDLVADGYKKFVDFVSADTPFSNLATDLGLLVGAGGLLTSFASKITGLKGIGKITIPIIVSYSLLKKADEIEEVVEEKTGSGTLGALSNIAATSTAGGLIASLFSKNPLVMGAGALIAGAPRVFEAGGELAQWTMEKFGKDTSGPSFYDFITGNKNEDKSGQNSINMTNGVKNDYFYNTDTVGG